MNAKGSWINLQFTYWFINKLTPMHNSATENVYSFLTANNDYDNKDDSL